MYRETKHDFRSTEEFEAAQRKNMEEGKNLELKSEMFVADREELERLRESVQASDMPHEEKSRALAYLDEQAKVLEATWEKDVAKPEEGRKREMEALIERAREYVVSVMENREKIENTLGEIKGAEPGNILREASKEQAELSAEYRRQLDEMDNFNNLRERSMAQHRQVVAR